MVEEPWRTLVAGHQRLADQPRDVIQRPARPVGEQEVALAVEVRVVKGGGAGARRDSLSDVPVKVVLGVLPEQLADGVVRLEVVERVAVLLAVGRVLVATIAAVVGQVAQVVGEDAGLADRTLPLHLEKQIK